MSRRNQGERFERGDLVQVLHIGSRGFRYWTNGIFSEYLRNGNMVVDVDFSQTLLIKREVRPNQVRRREGSDSDDEDEDEDVSYSEDEEAPVRRRSARAQAPAVRQQQVQPIKTIEVPEELKFYSVLELDNISKDECNGIALVLQTDSGEYITGCVSIDEIKLVNRNKPTTLGNNYMRLEIQGGLYNIKKPNWVKNINSLTIDMVPEPRTFYLEKEEVLRGVQPYKLVRLNIVVKPQEQAVAEEHIKPELEENTNKRTRKRGGKRLKTSKKRIKTNKRGKSKKLDDRLIIGRNSFT